MATPTVYKQRPHPEIVIHNRQPCEVLGWFDATHYTLKDGKRKFTALASECSEPKAPAAKEPKAETPETAKAPETDKAPETKPDAPEAKPAKPGKKAK